MTRATSTLLSGRAEPCNQGLPPRHQPIQNGPDLGQIGDNRTGRGVHPCAAPESQMLSDNVAGGEGLVQKSFQLLPTPFAVEAEQHQFDVGPGDFLRAGLRGLGRALGRATRHLDGSPTHAAVLVEVVEGRFDVHADVGQVEPRHALGVDDPDPDRLAGRRAQLDDPGGEIVS